MQKHVSTARVCSQRKIPNWHHAMPNPEAFKAPSPESTLPDSLLNPALSCYPKAELTLSQNINTVSRHGMGFGYNKQSKSCQGVPALPPLPNAPPKEEAANGARGCYRSSHTAQCPSKRQCTSGTVSFLAPSGGGKAEALQY